MKIKTYIVDAFTDAPFKGNQAGVCLLDKNLEDSMMQSIAKELGYSETAFVKKIDGENKYSIRYFSPVMEIPLCGHATMASSKVLFDVHENLNAIHFVNVENIDLPISKDGDNIVMEFPIYQTVPQDVPQKLISVLGITKTVDCVYNKETNIILIEIDDCDFLRKLDPDYEALYKSHTGINGILITAPSLREDYDFECRYFWPWSGTNEDPVTGAIHTFLTPHWAKKLNKQKLRCLQCSERTGFMEVELKDEQSVLIKSDAHIVFTGEMMI